MPTFYRLTLMCC